MAKLEESYQQARVIHDENCAVCAPFGVRVRSLKMKKEHIMLRTVFTIVEGLFLFVLGLAIGTLIASWFITNYMVEARELSDTAVIRLNERLHVQQGSSLQYEDGTKVLQPTYNPQLTENPQF